MSGPLSCETGASGACPYPVAAWAHPTSANMTNSAASGLCRFICFDLFPPNTSAYSARAISSIRLRSLLRTFPTRAHRPACHLGRRVGCERGLEAGRVRRLLSESCGPPFELQDRRHAVVDLGAQLVRRCRDDRKAAHPFIGRDRISPEAARDYHALSASAIAISDLPAPRIVRGAMNELHRIGVNLNQIARHANATGELRADLDATHAEVMRAITRILDQVRVERGAM